MVQSLLLENFLIVRSPETGSQPLSSMHVSQRPRLAALIKPSVLAP